MFDPNWVNDKVPNITKSHVLDLVRRCVHGCCWHPPALVSSAEGLLAQGLSVRQLAVLGHRWSYRERVTPQPAGKKTLGICSNSLFKLIRGRGMVVGRCWKISMKEETSKQLNTSRSAGTDLELFSTSRNTQGTVTLGTQQASYPWAQAGTPLCRAVL